jgi:hypothetical protein
MQTRGEKIHAEVDQARAGSTPNIVRWILSISLVAAIVLLTAIWVIGARSSDQDTQTVDAQIRAAEPETRNNAVVSDDADRMDAANPGADQNSQSVPNQDAAQ